MSNLGAAPYTPERPSLWERLVAWHVGRSTVGPEDIARHVAHMSEEEREALMPPFLRRATIDERIAALSPEEARAASDAALPAPLRAPYALPLPADGTPILK